MFETSCSETTNPPVEGLGIFSSLSCLKAKGFFLSCSLWALNIMFVEMAAFRATHVVERRGLLYCHNEYQCQIEEHHPFWRLYSTTEGNLILIYISRPSVILALLVWCHPWVQDLPRLTYWACLPALHFAAPTFFCLMFRLSTCVHPLFGQINLLNMITLLSPPLPPCNWTSFLCLFQFWQRIFNLKH